VTGRARAGLAVAGLAALGLAALGLSRSFERGPDVVVPPPPSDPLAGTLTMRDVVEVRAIAWPSLVAGALGLGLLAAAAFARRDPAPPPEAGAA
jgi:hypothetical protein